MGMCCCQARKRRATAGGGGGVLGEHLAAIDASGLHQVRDPTGMEAGERRHKIDAAEEHGPAVGVAVMLGNLRCVR